MRPHCRRLVLSLPRGTHKSHTHSEGPEESWAPVSVAGEVREIRNSPTPHLHWKLPCSQHLTEPMRPEPGRGQCSRGSSAVLTQTLAFQHRDLIPTDRSVKPKKALCVIEKGCAGLAGSPAGRKPCQRACFSLTALGFLVSVFPWTMFPCSGQPPPVWAPGLRRSGHGSNPKPRAVP